MSSPKPTSGFGTRPYRIFISTGEVSGDLQGSLLIEALHQVAAERQIDLEVYALGGLPHGPCGSQTAG
jgi:lipid-A-disaccharide synthase